MVNTRLQNRTKAAASDKQKSTDSEKAKPVKKSKPPAWKKARPGPKTVRFSDSSDTKSETNKRETTHRNFDRRDFGNRGFGNRNFDYPFGVQSAGIGYGQGFDWRYQVPPPSPFGYFNPINYPNYNSVGFSPQQHHRDNFHNFGYLLGKRGLDSYDDSNAPSDIESGGTPSAVVPAKRTARAKSGKWICILHKPIVSFFKFTLDCFIFVCV